MKLKTFITLFMTIIALLSILITFLPLMEESYSLRNALTEPNEKGACLKFQFYDPSLSVLGVEHNGTCAPIGGIIYLKGEGNHYTITADLDNMWANYSNQSSLFIGSFLIYPHKITSGEIANVNGIEGVFKEQTSCLLCPEIDNVSTRYYPYIISKTSGPDLFLLPTSSEGVVYDGSGCFNQTKSVNFFKDLYGPLGISLNFRPGIVLNFQLVKSNIKFTSLDDYYYIDQNTSIVSLLIVFSAVFLVLVIQRMKTKRKYITKSDILKNKHQKNLRGIVRKKNEGKK
jgi:hypothetical protein